MKGCVKKKQNDLLNLKYNQKWQFSHFKNAHPGLAFPKNLLAKCNEMQVREKHLGNEKKIVFISFWPECKAQCLKIDQQL